MTPVSVAARPRQACDEARADRVGDRSRRRSGSCGVALQQCRDGRTSRRSTMTSGRERDQFGRDLRLDARQSPVGPAVLDRNVAAVDPAQLRSVPARNAASRAVLRIVRRARAEYADASASLALLRARRQRPSPLHRRERDELPPLHSITSSARASSGRRHVKAECLGGLEIDRQLELGRLCTGRSAGFRP